MTPKNKKTNKIEYLKNYALNLFNQPFLVGLLSVLLTISLLLGLLFYPHKLGFLTSILAKSKLVCLTLLWACLGTFAGALISKLIENKGQIIISQNKEFIKFCQQSNGLLFFGPIGSGKTALLSWLAQELPGENKYATFPCGLPWAEKAQIDFSLAPSQRLGVKEDILIDEGNIMFQGNIVQEVRAKQRFLSHFVAFSRHQGTRIWGTYQRVGQAPIQMREVVTGMFQIELHHKTDEGIYIKLIRWQGVAWTTTKTDQEYLVFISKKYFDTYNSYWLKSLKYLRPKQGYI